MASTAMSMFSSLLSPQPPPPAPLHPYNQKPLPKAPSAPIPVPQPSSKPNHTFHDPAPTAPHAALVATPPSNSASTVCESCHVRPKHIEGGKMHDFCSKRCAAAAKNKPGVGSSSRKPSQGPSGPPVAAPGNCDHCHIRPKYNDGAQDLSFCSKSCAVDFRANLASSQQASNGNGTRSKNQCRIAGCPQPCQQLGGIGKANKYCSPAHKTLGETVCLMCRAIAKQGDLHFCGKTCADEAISRGPIILEVPEGHVTFGSVAEQFKTSWRHNNKSCPPVKAVYKIISSQASLAKYDSYRAAVEARGNFVASGRSAGNENRRWHGTRRECKLGDKGNTKFCASTSCSLCCIVKTSFDLGMFGKKTGWGRFGKGLYTSATSSKSDDYASNKVPSPYKAILLNKVVVGKGYKVTENATTMTGPPPGYDSVLAEKGGKLNHDELVIYDNDAIRPSFIVLFET